MIFLPVDILATGLAKAIGCPEDQAKVLVWLLIHVGCGYAYRQIRGSLNRNIYGMAVGTLFCLSMFGSQTLFLYAFLTGIYYVTMHFKRKAAIYVFGGGFFCLSFYHIKRMVENYGGYDMDLTLVLMQQLIRVTYFAWALRDMTVTPDKLPLSSVGRVLKEEPSLLEFLGYNFNFLGMMCPSVDFYDYTEFLHERGNFEHLPLKKEDHLILLRNIGIAVVVYLACSKLFLSPQDCLGPKVQEQNVLIRFILFNIAAFTFRTRYYIPWLISQLSIDLAGISYNKKSGNFDLYEHARPIDVEWTFWDPKRRVTVWNMGTQRWLRTCFYERFEAKLGKSNSAMATFGFSSLWHGFYLSYYVGFFYFHMCGEIQKLIFKNQEIVLGPVGSQRRLYTEKALNVFYLTMSNMAGVVFGGGMHLKDLWTLIVSSWFSPLHPVILYFAVQQYIISQKPNKPKH